MITIFTSFTILRITVTVTVVVVAVAVAVVVVVVVVVVVGFTTLYVLVRRMAGHFLQQI